MDTDYGEIFRSVRIGGIIKWNNRICIVTKKKNDIVHTRALLRKSGRYEVLCFDRLEFSWPEVEYLGVL